jgi:hypothetical protein
MVESNKLLIHDTDIIGEISTFIEIRGFYKADEGYHDDLVMTLVLFAWASNESFFKDLTDTNLRKVLYEEQFKQIEENLTPFGFIDEGPTERSVPEEDANGDLWFSNSNGKDMNKVVLNWLEKV